MGMALALIGAMRDDIDRLEERTKRFAVEVVALCVALERLSGLRNSSSQLNRAAGSVAANHRAMRRARSTREFGSKLQVVSEETDECVLWLEILQANCSSVDVAPLLREARELRAIFAKAKATTRARLAAEQASRWPQ